MKKIIYLLLIVTNSLAYPMLRIPSRNITNPLKNSTLSAVSSIIAEVKRFNSNQSSNPSNMTLEEKLTIASLQGNRHEISAILKTLTDEKLNELKESDFIKFKDLDSLDYHRLRPYIQNEQNARIGFKILLKYPERHDDSSTMSFVSKFELPDEYKNNPEMVQFKSKIDKQRAKDDKEVRNFFFKLFGSAVLLCSMSKTK